MRQIRVEHGRKAAARPRLNPRERAPGAEAQTQLNSVTQPVASPRRFVEKWREKASLRRAELARQLLSTPLDLKRVQKLRMWLENLEARKAWQEARLENIVGMESILRAAIERYSSETR